MWQELISELERQANKAGPQVRAGALLRIARVQTALDLAKARATFEAALEQIRSITGRNQRFFLEEAQMIAAAVAPELVSELRPKGRSRPHHFEDQTIVRTMLEHGHVDAAFNFVVHHGGDAETFPFSALFNLLQKVTEERRKEVLLKAVEVGRSAPSHPFVLFFRANYHLLPMDEARDVVRDVVKAVENRADRPINATYDPERTVVITSEREHTLFQLLDVLRKLDNELAISLIARYPQLATAAARYPNGLESISTEAMKRKPERPQGESCGGFGYAMVGNPKDFPYMRGLVDAGRTGEFEQSMAFAAEKYAEDTSPQEPNEAPKYFWPSTSMYRQVMYEAGKRNGEAASPLLDEINDAEVRLFAEIEFVAALAGLPQFQSVQRRHRPPALNRSTVQFDRGPLMRNVRCPKCQWVPSERNIWFCQCGHGWNTFQTRGVCPSCKFKWEETACHGCGETSAHKDWYVSE